MRKRIYDIIEVSGEGRLGRIYDTVMMIVIFLSLIPLAFKSDYRIFTIIDRVSAVVFAADYILRWLTADYKLRKKGVAAFIEYPFTYMAIIDLLSILPSVTALNRSFKALRILRLIKTFRMFVFFRAFRYSKNMKIIIRVLKRTKSAMAAVCTLAIGYILISAVVVFNVEPQTFNNFFDAVYWAAVSLTTVGYGDIYPVTTAGRIVTVLSAFVGVAVVALPAGVITAGYMKELSDSEENNDEE